MNELLMGLGPIIISVAISLGGALVISRYAGPAQAAYVTALEKRLAIVTAERDELDDDAGGLRARIQELERQVDELRSASGAKDREIADLYRRIDADERRLTADERRFPKGS
jgi:chromosome segregation ATPase